LKVTHIGKILEKEVEIKGASKTTIQLLINKPIAENFIMRRFRVEPSGYTTLHSHNYEHEVYVLQGVGEVTGNKESNAIKTGSVIFIPPKEIHQFKNTGKRDLVFLCLVPT
jgi:quercetin dioxygenase-like cupin family protein